MTAVRQLPVHKLPADLKRAKTICPQEYTGCEMRATPCGRCATGWDKTTKTCKVPMGVEHFPLVPAKEIPRCPVEFKCQHQVQLGSTPCAPRARGFICESALGLAGVQEPADHPLGFNATVMATPEDLEEMEHGT